MYAGRRVCVGICEEGNVCREDMFVCAEGVGKGMCVGWICHAKLQISALPPPCMGGRDVNFK